jgi:AcrR family transcriptional regulator
MATARTRKPAAERREEIAIAVLRIIGERGLTALTMATVAEEVGVTSGALFRHFPSREAILEAAARHAVERIEATFPDSSLPPLERLLELAANRVRVLGGDKGLAWLLRSQQAYLALPPGAVELLRDLVKRSKGFLLRALREAASEGSVRRDLEPEVLIVFVMGTIHALIGMTGVHATQRRPAKAEAVFSALKKILAPAEPAGPTKRITKKSKHR